MENKFTENAEMQSSNPAELSDDDLDSVSGGYTTPIKHFRTNNRQIINNRNRNVFKNTSQSQTETEE